VGWAAESRPGQRFSDARPLTLLAALSTGNHVIPPGDTHTSLPHLFHSCVFHQKPLSTHRYPVLKWIRPKSAAGPPLLLRQDIIERSGPAALQPLYTHLTPSSHPRPQSSSLLVDTMLEHIQLRRPVRGQPCLERRYPSLARRVLLDVMDQARLQGSNLRCSKESQEILALVQSLRSAPSVRGAFRPNIFC
jgi:hypothetical protein